jgi:hypothetical protein
MPPAFAALILRLKKAKGCSVIFWRPLGFCQGHRSSEKARIARLLPQMKYATRI